MSNGQKICERCRADVSNRPQTKDRRGRYLCADCVKTLKAKKSAAAAPAAAVASTEAAAPAGGGDMMAHLVDDAVSHLGAPCPACQSPMPEGAVMCTRCGHNAATGRNMRTRVELAKKDRSEAKAAAQSAAESTIEASTPVLTLIGGVIVGTIGAAMWAFIAYQTGFEFDWMALVVGILVGFGVAIGSRGCTSWLTGSIAAVIAVMSVFGGRFMAIQFMVDDMMEGVGEYGEEFAFSEIDAKTHLADAVCREFLDQGVTLKFRNGASLGSAWYPEGYPIIVRNETNKRWREMTPTNRNYYLEQAKQDSVTFLEIDAKMQLADEIAVEWRERDYQTEALDDYSYARSFYPHGYPPVLVDAAENRWASWSEADQQAYIAEGQFELDGYQEDVKDATVAVGFLSSLSPVDVIFLLFAVLTAYGVGNHGGDWFRPI